MYRRKDNKNKNKVELDDHVNAKWAPKKKATTMKMSEHEVEHTAYGFDYQI